MTRGPYTKGPFTVLKGIPTPERTFAQTVRNAEIYEDIEKFKASGLSLTNAIKEVVKSEKYKMNNGDDIEFEQCERIYKAHRLKLSK